MSITQETANLIDTLANAAGKVGSTEASAKINKAICELIPPSQIGELEAMVTQLQADNAQLTTDANAYRISNDIRGENLELLRGKLAEIKLIAVDLIESPPADNDGEKLSQIITLAAPIDA